MMLSAITASKRPVVAVNTRRQPKHGAEALRCSCFKRACSERAEQTRDMQQVLLRIIIHPGRYRIGGKSQDERCNGTVDLCVTGNSLDSQRLRIHDRVPVWSRRLRVTAAEWPQARASAARGATLRCVRAFRVVP